MIYVFKDVVIRGDRTKFADLINQMSNAPPPEWGRAFDKEPKVQGRLAPGSELAVFRFSGTPELPGCALFLSGNGDELEITNIVPEAKGVHELTKSQYNAFVDDFIARCLTPIARQLGLEIETTPDHLPIEHWMSSHAAGLLQAFVRNANVRFEHPLDTDRWIKFLVAVHLEHAALPTDILLRWLTEEQNWPEDTASDKVIEFEFALKLLDAYDADGR